MCYGLTKRVRDDMAVLTPWPFSASSVSSPVRVASINAEHLPEALSHPMGNYFPSGKEFFSSNEELLIPINRVLQVRHEFFQSLRVGWLQRRAI